MPNWDCLGRNGKFSLSSWPLFTRCCKGIFNVLRAWHFPNTGHGGDVSALDGLRIYTNDVSLGGVLLPIGETEQPIFLNPSYTRGGWVLKHPAQPMDASSAGVLAAGGEKPNGQFSYPGRPRGHCASINLRFKVATDWRPQSATLFGHHVVCFLSQSFERICWNFLGHFLNCPTQYLGKCQYLTFYY